MNDTLQFAPTEDYSHTLLEQQEMHYFSCVHDVQEAFQTHGIKDILSEVCKNPQLNQQLTDYIKSLQFKQDCVILVVPNEKKRTMTFTVETKSQLAKLLATENLTIVHDKISTARFDPINRILYCPIWNDMSGDLYDLLLGHEVGHARYTPAEGWHDAISGRGRNFKGFLNVVEDARIEKKIKRKYPGIRQSFIRGYQSLLDRDFFGIKTRDVNKLSFIDRLNIYTKSGGTLYINFTDEEVKMVNDVENCETWDDVLRVTEVVFGYSKDEQFETQQQFFLPDPNGEFEFDDNDSDPSDYDFDDTSPSDEDGDAEGSDKSGDSDEELDEESDEDGDGDGENGEGESGDQQGANLNRVKDSKPNVDDNFEPVCTTDEAFRNKEVELVDEKCRPFVYTKIPQVDLEKIVTPAKVVHQHLYDFYFKNEPSDVAHYNTKVKEFKLKNDRYIGLLAKEFEMKKAARSYAKAKVSNTGDIDIGKLYKYKVEDNIFKKLMRVPKGKSHGLVLLLDCSGSMRNNMDASIEQILVLTMFCRKVNIPFVVYGFGDSQTARKFDFKDQAPQSGFAYEEGDLFLQPVFLREYLNSKMSGAEFNACIRNMIALKTSYAIGRRNHPLTETLGNTPLVQAMVALEPITKQFRKVNNLDLVNLVIVHDGDADTTDFVVKSREVPKTDPDRSPFEAKRFQARIENIYIKDRNSKLQIKLDFHYNESHYNIDDSLRVAIFDWFRAVTGAKIFGFFVTETGRKLSESIANKYYDKKGRTIKQICTEDFQHTHWRYYRSEFVQTLSKKLKSEKFLESFNPGYDAFFMMPGGSEMNIEDDELTVTGAVTANKLKNAFMKMNKKKQINRVMVNRFIDGIAA